VNIKKQNYLGFCIIIIIIIIIINNHFLCTGAIDSVLATESQDRKDLGSLKWNT
jgi:hypothetical protein